MKSDREILDEIIQEFGLSINKTAITEIFNLRKLLLEEQSRTELFEDMMDRALKFWQQENPTAGYYWPDGAVNVEWVLERISKLEQYEIYFKNFIKFCENPNNRHRVSDKGMCKFLDDLRSDIIKLLNKGLEGE